jgi:hypothetical protein
MLCMECGAEMKLVQVVEDTTMFVSGYEHHTWQCSACSTVERRMTFTREKTPTPNARTAANPTAQSTETVPAEAAPTVQPTETASEEAAPTVQPTETVTVEPTEMLPVVLVQAVPSKPVQSIMVQMNARLQKLRSLQQPKATAAKEAAGDTERREEFNRFWESLR